MTVGQGTWGAGDDAVLTAVTAACHGDGESRRNRWPHFPSLDTNEVIALLMLK